MPTQNRIDMSTDDISALLAASIEESNLPLELSPEDAAWADSCLAPDPRPPNQHWSEIGEVLLRDIDSQYEAEQGVESKMATVEDEEELPKQLEEAYIGSRERIKPADEEDEEENELIKQLERVQIGSQEIESRTNIFKVWDIRTPEEDDDDEDEHINQFKKALAKSTFRSPAPTGHASAAAAEEQQVINELVAGIGVLSM